MRLLGIHNNTFATVMGRMIRVGMQSVKTRGLEVTAWVLVTAWSVGLVLWVWGNFNGLATMP